MGTDKAHLELKLHSGVDRVSVAELGLALVSISDLYEDFAIKMGASRAETKFEIQDLRKGSAILEIVGVSIGLMDQALILKQFYQATTLQISQWIAGIPKNTTLSEAEVQSSKMLGLAKSVAESDDGSLSMAYLNETESTKEVLMMTKEDGQKMLENFASVSQRFREKLPARIDYDEPQRVLMRLYQHNQDPDPSQKRRTSHKAIIKDVDSKPRPLTYFDSEIASDLRDIVSEVPYANTLFDVVIELVREDDTLKSYRLIEIHGYFDDPDFPLLEQ